MRQEDLVQALPAGSRLLIDTNPIVYVLAGHRLAQRFLGVFAAIEAGRFDAVVTPITVAEVVAGPLKQGRESLARRYEHSLTARQGWTYQDIGPAVAFEAARWRVHGQLKLPDAFQLACALAAGCSALVTHDRDFKGIKCIPVVGLDP